MVLFTITITVVDLKARVPESEGSVRPTEQMLGFLVLLLL